MQIKIVFSSEKDIIIPIHYNSLIQAFIYNNIDDELASFLHDRVTKSTIGSSSFYLFQDT